MAQATSEEGEIVEGWVKNGEKKSEEERIPTSLCLKCFVEFNCLLYFVVSSQNRYN